MKLTELVQEAEKIGDTYLDKLYTIIKGYDFSKQPMCPQWLIEDKYVRNLAGLCTAIKAKNAAEIGTMYGNSAIGLSMAFRHIGNVHSYDINHNNIVNKDLLVYSGIITITLKDNLDFLNIPFNDYDLIFVDIGVHTGYEETLVHNKLLDLNYKGIVAYDDVSSMWPGMLPFWDKIEQEKVLTDWHSSGFGIVKYV